MNGNDNDLDRHDAKDAMSSNDKDFDRRNATCPGVADVREAGSAPKERI